MRPDNPFEPGANSGAAHSSLGGLDADDPRSVPYPTMKLRLLLIESPGSALDAMQEYFEVRGYDVLRARDPDEAHAALQKADPVVVVVDLGPGPEANGGLDTIRSARRLRGPRVIALGWSVPAAAREQARDAGAGVVLDRPCRLGEIAEIVERLLGEPEA